MVESQTEQDFFDPQRLWVTLLGDNGRGGVIGEIHEILTELKDGQIAHTNAIVRLDGRITEYNGLKKDVKRIDILLNKQVNICEQVQERKITEEEWKQTGRDEEHKRFERTIKLAGIVFAGVTVFTGTITWFMGLWPI